MVSQFAAIAPTEGIVLTLESGLGYHPNLMQVRGPPPQKESTWELRGQRDSAMRGLVENANQG
jgi:hypothetical protein